MVEPRRALFVRFVPTCASKYDVAMGSGRRKHGRGFGRGQPPTGTSGTQTARLRRALGPAALILALTFVVYAPAMRAGFIWDDDVYITANPLLESLPGLRDIWLRPGATMQYYPLAFTTLWVEHHLWGDNPAGYHVVNIALHGACAVLLWMLLLGLGVRGAWLAAAIFAVHPVLVESVAWCAELKNVQSGVLYLLCLLAYFRASPPEDEPAPPAGRQWGLYALALLLFGAALLTKPAAVALPLVILLIVWWRRGRVGTADALRVAPMLAMGLAMGLITIYAEKEFSAAGWDASLLERGLVAGRALAFYAGKLLWPAPLASIYPRWEVSAAVWWQYLFPAAVVAALAVLWLMRVRLGRGLLAAALAFVLLAAPAIGFFDVAYFQYSFVADHFQYHAAPALIAIFAAAVAFLDGRLRTRALGVGVTVAGVLLVLALGVLTSRHATVFASERSRCLDTIAKNPRAWVAMESLGMALAAEGKPREAIRLYEQALRIKPDYADAHNNLGVALVSLREMKAASREFQEALRISPDSAQAHENLGRNLELEGNVENAIWHFREVVRLRPRHAGARVRLGTALVGQGSYDEAIEQFQRALALDPGNPAARNGLDRALTLQRTRRPPDTR